MVQLAAGPEWAEAQGQRYAQLAAIKQSVLVVNGKNDIMLPTVNSFIMNAQLILYPDRRPPRQLRRHSRLKAGWPRCSTDNAQRSFAMVRHRLRSGAAI